MDLLFLANPNLRKLSFKFIIIYLKKNILMATQVYATYHIQKITPWKFKANLTCFLRVLSFNIVQLNV